MQGKNACLTRAKCILLARYNTKNPLLTCLCQALSHTEHMVCAHNHVPAAAWQTGVIVLETWGGLHLPPPPVSDVHVVLHHVPPYPTLPYPHRRGINPAVYVSDKHRNRPCGAGRGRTGGTAFAMATPKPPAADSSPSIARSFPPSPTAITAEAGKSCTRTAHVVYPTSSDVPWCNMLPAVNNCVAAGAASSAPQAQRIRSALC